MSQICFSQPSLLQDLRRLALSKSREGTQANKTALSELSEHYVDLCNSVLSTTSPQRYVFTALRMKILMQHLL